jgi:hypothetical protein
MLFEGETIECEYCGKTIIVTEDEPKSNTWLSVSYVSYDEEKELYLFCSFECLEKYMRLTEQEREQRFAMALENEALAKEMKKPRKNWIKE